MLLKIPVTKTLNIKVLYDDIIDDFSEYNAAEDVNLSNEDITPEVAEKIFTALAQEAHERIEKNKGVRKN